MGQLEMGRMEKRQVEAEPENPYQGIVIFMPTRNRAEIAMQSIDLIVDMTVQDLYLLVSDNSTDETQAKTLEAFCKSKNKVRLHYIRPSEPLSMAANMDWLMGEALARFTANHFLCLWDRIALKPEAPALLRQLALRYPDHISTFLWDEVLDAEEPVRLYQRPWTGRLFEVAAAHLLWLAAQSREKYTPKMTNCLMPRSVIEAVKARFGSYCNSITADICFGYRALALVESVLLYDRALTVTYALSRSNAHSQHKGVYNQDTKDFLTTLQQENQVLNWAAPIPEASVPANQTFHEFCLVQRHVKSDRFPEVNWKLYLEKLAAGTAHLQNGEARQVMENLLAKHNQRVPDSPWPTESSPEWLLFLKKQTKRLLYNPYTQPIWLTLARKIKLGLPLRQDFSFRSSREALECALHCPAHRLGHTGNLHDLYAQDLVEQFPPTASAAEFGKVKALPDLE